MAALEILKYFFFKSNTKELSESLKNNELTTNELKAIQKVLYDRQLFPN